MQLRYFVFALAIGSAASAFASFDMMIAPEQTAGAFYRYDPINRVALGKINISGGSKVTASSFSQNGLYEYPTGNVLANNFTGERVSIATFSTNNFSYNRNATQIASQNGSSVVLGVLNGLNTFSSTNSWTAPGGVTLVGAVATNNNRWVAYGYTATSIVGYLLSNTGAVVGSATTLLASNNFITTGFGQGALSTSPSGTDVVILPYRDSGGAHKLLYANVTASAIGGGSTQSVLGFSTANASTTVCATEAHAGFFLVGADSAVAGSTRIIEFDNLGAYVAVQNYTTTAWESPTGRYWRMSNVVAPEPGPFVAMGLGLGALMLRKRRRSK